MPKLRLQDLLEDAAESPAIGSITLTHDDLIELSAYLGRVALTKDQLFLACQSLSTVSVDGQEITLEPKLLARLKSRCLGAQAFGPWLKKVVIEQLHGYVGW